MTPRNEAKPMRGFAEILAEITETLARIERRLDQRKQVKA